jgi:hypothetical protein
LKSIIDDLPVTASLTMQVDNFCARENFVQYETTNPLNGSDKNARQKEYMHTSSNHYVHVSGKNYNAYSFDYANPSWGITHMFLERNPFLLDQNHLFLSNP